MFFSFVYLLVRRLVRLVACSSNDLKSEVEVVVLRDQLMVLKRHCTGRAFAAATGCSWPP